MEAGYLSLIFLAHSLEVLPDGLGCTCNHGLVFLPQLANQRQVKRAGLVFVVNFGV